MKTPSQPKSSGLWVTTHKLDPLRVCSVHTWVPGESPGSEYGNDNQGLFFWKLPRSAEAQVWLAKGQAYTCSCGNLDVQGLLLTSHQLLERELEQMEGVRARKGVVAGGHPR